MKIGFDAKRAFCNNTGLGNYSRWVIDSFEKFYPENKYYLFSTKSKRNFKHHSTEVFPSGILKFFKSLWRLIAIDKSYKDLDVFLGLSNEIPLGLKCKKIVVIHDTIFLRYPQLYPFIDRFIYHQKWKYASRVANMIIAISEQTKQDLVDFYKISPSKIKVIAINCSSIFYTKPKEEYINDLKNIIHYNEKKHYYLYVGKFEERKNHILLLKAFNKIKNNTNAEIIMVGRKGDTYLPIRRYINDNDLQSRVHIITESGIHQLHAAYGLCSSFIYVSLFEGFGIPLIEAMAMNKPIVAPNQTHYSSITQSAAIYFNDELDLSQKLLDVQDENVQNKLVNGSKVEVLRFSDKILISEYQSVIENI